MKQQLRASAILKSQLRVRFVKGDDEAYREHAAALLLMRDGDKAIRAVGKENGIDDKGYKLIEAVVDSGVEESVAPPRLFPGNVAPSVMSRAEWKYRAAHGARIPNLCQQKVALINEMGQRCGTIFQIAEVECPLLSASQLAASGNSGVFDQKGGRTVNIKTGKSMVLHRRGGSTSSRCG
jgi:hypothetical protein